MCSVSAVSDYYTRTYPDRFGINPFQPGTAIGAPLGSGLPTVPTVDAETKEMMRKVLQLLDKIDKRLGDVECMDEAKAEFLKGLDLDPNNIGG
jgi:hypothetical protein